MTICPRCGHSSLSASEKTLWVDDAVIACCNAAHAAAEAHGADEVSLSHLLHALAATPSAHRALLEYNIDPDALAEATAPKLTRFAASGPVDVLKTSDEIKVVLVRAERMAINAGQDHTKIDDVVHTLATAVGDLPSGALIHASIRASRETSEQRSAVSAASRNHVATSHSNHARDKTWADQQPLLPEKLTEPEFSESESDLPPWLQNPGLNNATATSDTPRTNTRTPEIAQSAASRTINAAPSHSFHQGAVTPRTQQPTSPQIPRETTPPQSTRATHDVRFRNYARSLVDKRPTLRAHDQPNTRHWEQHGHNQQNDSEHNDDAQIQPQRLRDNSASRTNQHRETSRHMNERHAEQAPRQHAREQRARERQRDHEYDAPSRPKFRYTTRTRPQREPLDDTDRAYTTHASDRSTTHRAAHNQPRPSPASRSITSASAARSGQHTDRSAYGRNAQQRADSAREQNLRTEKDATLAALHARIEQQETQLRELSARLSAADARTTAPTDRQQTAPQTQPTPNIASPSHTMQSTAARRTHAVGSSGHEQPLRARAAYGTSSTSQRGSVRETEASPSHTEATTRWTRVARLRRPTARKPRTTRVRPSTSSDETEPADRFDFLTTTRPEMLVLPIATRPASGPAAPNAIVSPRTPSATREPINRIGAAGNTTQSTNAWPTSQLAPEEVLTCDLIPNQQAPEFVSKQVVRPLASASEPILRETIIESRERQKSTASDLDPETIEPENTEPQDDAVETYESREKRFYLMLGDDVVRAPSIGPKTAERLIPNDIITVRDLLLADPVALATRVDYRAITAQRIRLWQMQSRLVCTIPWLRGTHAQILVGAGYDTPEKIAAADRDQLTAAVAQFAATRDGQSILRAAGPPDPERVWAWVGFAKQAEGDRAPV